MYHFTGLYIQCSEKQCKKEHMISNPENLNAARLYTQAREDGWHLQFGTDLALCPNCKTKKEKILGKPLDHPMVPARPITDKGAEL